MEVKPLSDREILEGIARVVSEYLPDATVYLFGSRAEGRANPRSDFDVAIEWKGKIPLSTIAMIREKLDSLPTLKSFDLVDVKRVSDSFARYIRRKGVILYDGR